MKIFLSFLQSRVKRPIPAYDFWEYYIKNGIEEAGHEWIECAEIDWAKGMVPMPKKDFDIWFNQTWDNALAYLKKNPADLFLSYLYPHQVNTTAILQLKSMGIRCVNFFCDNVREYNRAPSEFKVFDVNWVPELQALAMYQKAGFAYLNLPMPVWIKPAFRINKPEINSQVTFIGSKDIQRHLLFEEIVAEDPSVNLAVYGSGWQQGGTHTVTDISYTLKNKINFQLKLLKQFGVKGYYEKLKQRNYRPEISADLITKIKGRPTSQEYNILTSQSMVTVGVNRYPSFRYPLNTPHTYSRLRDIEAPMLGACYLTEWTEGLDILYDIDKEITTYKTVEEFLVAVGELKNNEAKRKMLKTNGQKRALTDHTITESLRKIKCFLSL